MVEAECVRPLNVILYQVEHDNVCVGLDWQCVDVRGWLSRTFLAVKRDSESSSE